MYGDPADNTVAWSIKFDTDVFDQFAFMTPDMTFFIIANKADIFPLLSNGNACNFIRSNNNPTAPLITGQCFTDIQEYYPIYALSHYNLDALYAEDSHIWMP